MRTLWERYGLLAAGAAASVAVGGLVAGLGAATKTSLHSRRVRLDAVLAGAAVFLGFTALQAVREARERGARERRLLGLSLELQRREADLDRLAATDALTAVHNRRFFFERLGLEFRRAKRYGRGLACILLDIDDFKAVNDAHGHQHGDFVLAELALLLSGDLRESDLIARYGGDQFVILLPETDAEEAAVVAGRIQATVREHVFDDGMAATRLTVSQGVAGLRESGASRPDELLHATDAALLEAKRQGRDRVEVAVTRDSAAI